MYVDFDGKVGESNTDKLLDALRKVCRNTLVLDSKEVPWFPRHISQLDLIANRTLDAGERPTFFFLSFQVMIQYPFR